MRHAFTLTAAAMLVVAGATASRAQARPRNPQPNPGPAADAARPMQPGMPMHMPGGPPAAHVLQMKEMLGLSDDQVKRLETLAASQRTTLEPNRGAMLRAEADMADAMKGEGNLDAVRAAMDKMSRLHNDEAIAHMKAMQDARSVLTAEQRDKLRGMMMGMRMQHRDAGGPHGMGPGMQHPDGHGMQHRGGPGMRRPGGQPATGDERP